MPNVNTDLTLSRAAQFQLREAADDLAPAEDFLDPLRAPHVKGECFKKDRFRFPGELTQPGSRKGILALPGKAPHKEWGR